MTTEPTQQQPEALPPVVQDAPVMVATTSEPLTAEQQRDLSQVVSNLDPDLQQAVATGNQAVIQAVLSGATTTTQVLDAMMRSGNTSGLPAGLQQLMDDRQKQIKEQQDAEIRALVGAGVGIIGAGLLWGAAGNAADAATKEGGEGGLKSWGDMSAMERAVFLVEMSNMSYEQWSAKSDQERKLDIEKTKAGLQDALEKNEETRAKFIDDLHHNAALGGTPDEQRRNADQVIKNAEDSRLEAMHEKGLTEADVKKMSASERNSFFKRVDEIRKDKNRESFGDDPNLLKVADEAGSMITGSDKRRADGQSLKDKLENTPDDPEVIKQIETYLKVKDGATGATVINKDSEDLETRNAKIAAMKDKLGNETARADAREEYRSSANTIEAGAVAAAGNAQDVAQVDRARAENLEARKTLDAATEATTVAQAVAAGAAERNGDDLFAQDTPSPASPVASAEPTVSAGQPRLSIDVADKLNGQMLARVGTPEPAANDPAPTPAAPVNRPAAGMGA